MITIDLSGATRVIAIIGDPIAQVKSPAGVTAELIASGMNAIVVPMHVTSPNVDALIAALSAADNVDGIIATIPHKFAAYPHCATASDRAHFLRSVNTLRRNRDGRWHGDALDGVAFVQGVRNAGVNPAGQRVLLVGAGGAGSAIALALLESDIAELAIHDGDTKRRDDLIARLGSRFPGHVHAGSTDPTGSTLIVNATPSGMRESDAYPIDLARLDSTMFVGDVITAPEVTPLIASARQMGCVTQTGIGMFAAVMKLIVDFLVEASSS